MRKSAAFILLACLSAASAAEPPQEPIQEKTFEVSFEAGFLRPAVSHVYSGDEILFGPIQWEATDTGVVTAQMWDLPTVVEFKTNERRDHLENLKINAPDKGGSPVLWDAWRHRHGYLLAPGLGYYWATNEDEKVSLNADEGQFFDKFLKAVWTYWIVKRLPEHIAHPNVASLSDRKSEADNGARMRRSITLRYDSHGVRESALLPFQIYVWDVPVKINFEVTASTSPAADPDLRYKCRWTYDQGDWRRLHGYEKDFFGFRWDSDFPPEIPLTNESALRLEGLMDKNIAYWVDVAAQMIAADLNNQLQDAISLISPPEPQKN